MAAFRAIARLGPARLTLADVATDVGVSPAAIVQRFGSKRALLLATAADAAGGGQRRSLTFLEDDGNSVLIGR